MPEAFPLFERFPGLASIPRARICILPSPVTEVATGGAAVWVKRDDLNAEICGGNKARALEFLLGGLGKGDTVVVVGGAGSTHVLSTLVHARRLGLKVHTARWTHEMNETADAICRRVDLETGLTPGGSVPGVVLRARFRSIRQRSRFFPIGGSEPLGVLGHVNAGLELAEQVRAGHLPAPDRIVVALASGGTAAGLLLGCAAAGLGSEIVGARVGPRPFVNRFAVLSLARRTASLIESRAREKITVNASRFRIVHNVYAGAYGRMLPAAQAAANILHESSGIRLDHTYSAKAWVAALDEARRTPGRVLFWLTFDARCLTN